MVPNSRARRFWTKPCMASQRGSIPRGRMSVHCAAPLHDTNWYPVYEVGGEFGVQGKCEQRRMDRRFVHRID